MNLLYSVARNSILAGLTRGEPLGIRVEAFPDGLQEIGAAFVTLNRGGELRGCMGTLKAYRPLVKDVAHNAFAAAFRDSRFDLVSSEEMKDLEIKVSVLSDPELVEVDSEEELLEAIRPGVDGIILEWDDLKATFLPSVWEQLPEPEVFLQALKNKAKFPGGGWMPNTEVYRYTVKEIPA